MSIKTKTRSLIETLAEQAGISADAYYDALVRVPFAQCKNISREEMTTVLLMAKKLDLDPFAKEIYAVPGRYENSPITPVIGYDGWLKILLRQPTFDGLEAHASETTILPEGFNRHVPEYCEVVIYDKNRSHPVRVREYFEEVQRVTYAFDNKGKRVAKRSNPWVSMPWRMLRAKTVIQAVRNAYPVGGFEDSTELTDEPIIEDSDDVTQVPTPVENDVKQASRQVSKRGYPTIADKTALNALLERLITRVSNGDKPLEHAVGWIEQNIAEDSQSYSVLFVRERLAPKPVEEKDNSFDEFDFSNVHVEQQEVAEEQSVTASVPATDSTKVQAKTTQKPVEANPLGAADEDSFGLESFIDDIDIDSI